jgi:hypothetical protein
MATGTALCPYCSTAARQDVRQSGELISDYNELLRHRHENAEPEAVTISGIEVAVPGGFRPIFSHSCPVAQHPVTLYADTEGGARG